METSEDKAVEIPAKKPRKAYTRQAKPEIPVQIAPQLPNPNIAIMENKVAELVEQRMQAQFQISRVNQQFVAAGAALQSAKDEFSRIENEIHYRMALIQQMRGGQQTAPPVQMYAGGTGYANAPIITMSPTYAPANPYPTYPAPFDPRMVPAHGVGSAPAPNHLYPDVAGGPDGARTASAEELRADEMRLRGY